MEPIEFLRRFLVHTGIALGLWYAGLVTVEKLIPGFVSPFVDLAQIGLGTLTVSGMAVFLVKGLRTRWHFILDTLAFFALLAAALAYILAKFSGLGWPAYVLIAAGTSLALVAYYELWFDRLAD
ncbi:MAG: hypothetical protein WC551_03700 [Patescibacteria group bacterium]